MPLGNTVHRACPFDNIVHRACHLATQCTQPSLLFMPLGNTAPSQVFLPLGNSLHRANYSSQLATHCTEPVTWQHTAPSLPLDNTGHQAYYSSDLTQSTQPATLLLALNAQASTRPSVYSKPIRFILKLTRGLL